MDGQGLERFLYITGADGTGKSTHAQLLMARLQDMGMPCNHLWMRFPFFFSLPLLAYARWRRYSWHEVKEGLDYGYWDFSASRLMKSIFPWILLVDATLASMIHVYLPLSLGKTIVCERYVLDMIVDLAVALDNPVFHQNRPGTLFLRLLPSRCDLILLDLDLAMIRRRRQELRFDKYLEVRLATYRSLADDLSLTQISTAGPVDHISTQIWAAVGGP